jgi:hypothetical protein
MQRNSYWLIRDGGSIGWHKYQGVWYINTKKVHAYRAQPIQLVDEGGEVMKAEKDLVR